MDKHGWCKERLFKSHNCGLKDKTTVNMSLRMLQYTQCAVGWVDSNCSLQAALQALATQVSATKELTGLSPLEGLLFCHAILFLNLLENDANLGWGLTQG